MDSVGILDGRAAAIEVKVHVTAPMVRFRPDAGNSLEAKIAHTLRCLDGPIPRWLDAFETHWDRTRRPTVAILAAGYSPDGLDALREMLSLRSSEWEFAFEVWRWNGERLEVLASASEPSGVGRSAGGVVPELVGRPVRNPPRTLAQLRELAAAAGHGSTFGAFVDGARARGLTVSPRRTGIAIGCRATGAQRATVFVEGAGAEGLNVGIDADWLGVPADALPGVPAPVAGFMNANRLARGPDEAIEILNLMAARSRCAAPVGR